MKNVNTHLAIAGLSVTINDNAGPPYCQGAMRLDDSNVLVGQMICRGITAGDSYNLVTAKIRARVT